MIPQKWGSNQHMIMRLSETFTYKDLQPVYTAMKMILPTHFF